MPTYMNHHPNQYITFAHERKSFNLAPGSSLETELILDHIEWLRRIDDAPFYNPSEARYCFSGDVNDVAEIPVDYLKVHNAKIDTSGCIDVYINSINNEPPHRVTNCLSVSLDEDGRTDKLLFKFIEKAEVCLVLYRRKRTNRL